MRVMGEWEVGQWIVGVISFQKIYGLYGLNILQSDLNGPSVEKLEKISTYRLGPSVGWAE